MTTLIRNIQLIDGTGKAPTKADVLIKRKKISAIGYFPRYRAHVMIDGRGAYLAPGFIDIHSTIDRYLEIFSEAASEDSAKNLLLQGVTTVIGGQDGISLAPLFYGSLHLLREWTDIRKLNVNWHTLGELFRVMRRRPLTLNFGTFIGYQTLRHSLIGDKSRNLTSNELRVLKYMLQESLKEGAFGFSVGPEDIKSGVPFLEMKGLMDIVVKFKAIYAAELYGDKEEKISSLHRMLNMSEEIGLRTLINHLEPPRSLVSEYEKILESVTSSSARADISFDIYPKEASVLPAYNLLPDWLTHQSIDQILEKLQDKNTREKVIRELPAIKGDDILIVSAPNHEYLEGKSLKEFSHNRGLTLFTGFLMLIELTRGRVIISYRNISLKSIIKGLVHGQSIVASADMHLKKAPQDVFPKLLDLIGGEKILPLETAVYKMSGLPALKLGLKNRGLVRIGNMADLVIFRDGETRDVILNGQRVVRDGQFQNVSAGEVLRRGFRN